MLSGLVAAAAIVLVISGSAKIARPGGTVAALRAAGMRLPNAAATTIGAIEIALGAVVLAWAPPIAVGVLAFAYAVFAAFSIRLLSVQGNGASCGCFGQTESPLHWTHAVVNLAVATSVASAAFGGWATELASMPISVAVAALVLAGTLILALTLLPQILIAAGQVIAPTEH